MLLFIHMSEAQLTEHLKTLRLLHQILMVVSAAILAFALRGDPSTEYRAALNELSTLRELSFDGWSNFVNNRYRSIALENEKFVRGIIRDAELPIAGHPTLALPTCYLRPPAIFNARLVDFDSFISGIRPIGAFQIGAIDRRYLVTHLKELLAARNPHPSVSNMFLGLSATDCPKDVTSNTTPLYFQINDQPQTVPNQPIYVLVTYSVITENGQFVRDWMKTDALGKKLIDEHTGEALPNLKQFWERLSSLTVEQATGFVQEQLETSARGTLSFFGIPVERSLAISAGPIVCFSILLFFCLHVRQFRTVTEDVNVVPSYPFAALFQSPVAAISVIYFTVLLLPVFSNTALLWKFGRLQEVSTQLGMGFSIATLGLSVWCVIELHRMRRRWFDF
jgi:hypothetical protein